MKPWWKTVRAGLIAVAGYGTGGFNISVYGLHLRYGNGFDDVFDGHDCSLS